MTAREKLAAYRQAWREIVEAEAEVIDATGSDRRTALRRLNERRRAYAALRRVEIDGLPETTGDDAPPAIAEPWRTAHLITHTHSHAYCLNQFCPWYERDMDGRPRPTVATTGEAGLLAGVR